MTSTPLGGGRHERPTTPRPDTANVVALPPLIYLGPLSLGLVLNAGWPRDALEAEIPPAG